MAIAYRVAGSATTGATVTHPSGIVAGDLGILQFARKYPNVTTMDTPSGWTLAGDFNIGIGGTGDGIGEVGLQVFTKVMAGTEGSSNLATTVNAAANCRMSRIFIFSKAAAATWETAIATGADDTSGTAFSATATTDPGIAVDDFMVLLAAVNDNRTFSAQAVTATGATFGAATERGETATAVGDDLAFCLATCAVTAGLGTAAPVFTCTLNGAAQGVGALLRLREIYNVGSSAGTSTVAGVGEAKVNSVASSIGVATVTGFGEAISYGVASSIGVATVTGFNDAISYGVGSSAGAATATGFGEAIFYGVGSSAGVATATSAYPQSAESWRGRIELGASYPYRGDVDVGAMTFALTGLAYVGSLLESGHQGDIDVGALTFALTGPAYVGSLLESKYQGVMAPEGDDMFSLVQGDLSPSLTATLMNAETGVAVDLTTASGVSAKFKIGENGNVTTTAATVVTAASGIVRYDWGASDTTTAGRMYLRFVATFPTAKPQTFPSDGTWFEFEIHE